MKLSGKNNKNVQNFVKILIFTKKMHVKFVPFFSKNLPFLPIFLFTYFRKYLFLELVASFFSAYIFPEANWLFCEFLVGSASREAQEQRVLVRSRWLNYPLIIK